MSRILVCCVAVMTIFTLQACAKDDSTGGEPVVTANMTSSVVSTGEVSGSVSDSYGKPLFVVAEQLLSDIFGIGDRTLSDELLVSKLGSKPEKVDIVEVKNLYENSQIDKMLTYVFPGRTVKLYENTATKERYLLGLRITEKGNSLLFGIDIGFEKEKLIQLLGFDSGSYASVDTLSIVNNEGGAALSFKFESKRLIEIEYTASM